MGNWNISIEGVGCHHNADHPSDADKMAAAFVDALKGAGHVIGHATFTSGGVTDLGKPNALHSVYQPSPTEGFVAKEIEWTTEGVIINTTAGRVFISKGTLSALLANHPSNE